MPLRIRHRLNTSCAAWACATLAVGAGCQMPSNPSPRTTDALTVDDVLARCVATYRDLRTLHADGLIVDNRGGRRRIERVRWDYERPGRCRLQIGGRFALIVDDSWWTYDAVRQRFLNHRQFTRTPIITAAHLLSDGLPFITPAILEGGERALGGGQRGFQRWEMGGVGWRSDRPCYILTEHSADARSGVLTLWVDQDRFLIRGWTVRDGNADPAGEPWIECTYEVVIADGPLSPDCFHLRRPTIENVAEGPER